MAFDKVMDSGKLEAELTEVANAIREKTGGEQKLTIPEMAQEIRKMPELIVNTVTGSPITLTDSTELKLRGLKLFGKTTQDGTPTPENPVELVSAGDGGSITVKVGESEADENLQTLTISTPNGLPGIPVTSGGNYTDNSGQKWVCDEIDFTRGVYVQRIANLTGSIIAGLGCSMSTPSYGPDLNSFTLAVDGSEYEEARVGFGFCSHLPVKMYAELGNYESAFFDKWIHFRLFKSRVSSVAEFKEWAANNNFRVQYILATPIETPLTNIDLSALHTHYPNTTIFNDAGTGMEVSYVADTKLYLDKQVNALAAAIEKGLSL